MKKNRVTKFAFISTLGALFVCSLTTSCNPTSKKVDENPTPIKFNSISNVVKVTFDAGDGYVDDTYTMHSTQIEVHRGLSWKYIHNRLPSGYLYNHTFDYWMLHGAKVEDTYQINSDVTVSAKFTANKIPENTLRLNAGEGGSFSSGSSILDVGEFTANSTFKELFDQGLVERPTPKSDTQIFAGYKDPNGNLIEDTTRINFKLPESGNKYVLTATYVDRPESFETDSWESLVAASNQGLAYLKNIYGIKEETENAFIGREKNITLNNGITYKVRVIGEQTDKIDGGGLATLTFEFENVLIPNQAFDTYYHNNNKYYESSLSKSLDKLINMFPDCLKGTEGIRKVSKVTNSGMKGGSKGAETKPYRLFPLSINEMNLNNDSYKEEMTDSFIYTYYNLKSITPEYSRTYIDPITKEETRSDYWLRSPDYNSDIACNFLTFDEDNQKAVYPLDVNAGKGVAPAFCIGQSSEKINVTFDVSSEGGMWSGGSTDPVTKEMKSGAMLKTATSLLPDYSKEASTFAGWYTCKTEGAELVLDKLYTDDTKVFVNTTLRAHFIAYSELVDVTFEGNGQYESSGATKTIINTDYVTQISPNSTEKYHQAPNSTRGIVVEEISDPKHPKAITNFTVDLIGNLKIPAKYVTGPIRITVKFGTIAYNVEDKIAQIAIEDENYSKSGGKDPGEIARGKFSIGDILNVAVNDGSSQASNYRAILVGLGHTTDTFKDGDKDVVSAFTFEFLDMPSNVEIAYSSQDKPSYADSLIKSTTEGYYDKLANSNLKGAIKEVSHTTTKDYSESSYATFKTQMFVLSAAEHANVEEAQAPTLEGKQYEYYEKYNDHAKYRDGGLASYWLRTSYVSEAGYNRSYYVYQDGQSYNYTNYHKVNYKGIAPAFCI